MVIKMKSVALVISFVVVSAQAQSLPEPGLATPAVVAPAVTYAQPEVTYAPPPVTYYQPVRYYYQQPVQYYRQLSMPSIPYGLFVRRR
jgi:hypothetical protein